MKTAPKIFIGADLFVAPRYIFDAYFDGACMLFRIRLIIFFDFLES